MAFDLTCPADLSTLRIVGTDADVDWEEVVDHAGGVDIDGGGTEPITTFVDEVVAGAVYRILKNVEFGDGTNSLTFNSLNEMVYFIDDMDFTIEDNATLNLGEKYEDYGQNGSMWSVALSGSHYFIAVGDSDASFNMYASMLKLRSDAIYYWGNGTNKSINAIISGSYLGCKLQFRFGTYTIKNLQVNNIERFYFLEITVSEMEKFHVHNAYHGLDLWDNYTLNDVLLSSIGSLEIILSSATKTINIANPRFHLADGGVNILNAPGVVKERYSCDLLIVDEDGTILTGADILCQRTALVESTGSVYKAKQDVPTNYLPSSYPAYWEDVSDIYSVDDVIGWNPTLEYVFEEEVFNELQADRIEIDCDDHAAIEGTYVQQASSEDYNGEWTYKLEGSSWYIWMGAQWWTLSAEIGNTDGAYVGGSTPYVNYEPPGDPYFDSAVPTQLEPLVMNTQYLDRQTWETTNELLRNWEYEFIITHSDYPTLTLPRCLVTEIIDWRIDMGLSTSDVADALESALESNVLNTVGKMFVNKAVQNKNTGVVQYYDDDGETVILTHTPSDEESEITRTPN